jgi:hypothetical protein
MINLLPPDIKQNYSYARRNTKLIRWVVAFSFAFVGLAVLSVGGIFYLNQTAKSYDKQVNVQQAALKSQNQAATVKQVTEISTNLKLTLQVLSKQVLYSQLLKQLATIIPSNTALSNLNISQVQGALDITASAADYAAATQLQVNLSDPSNKIFTKADIVSISCATATPGSQQSQKYPCTITVRALFAPNNPYLFAGNSTGTKAK